MVFGVQLFCPHLVQLCISTVLEVRCKGTMVGFLLWTAKCESSVQKHEKESCFVALTGENVASASWSRHWEDVEEEIFRFSPSLSLFLYSCLSLCLLSGVPAKWMLCLQHVLVPSSGVCVCVCWCARVRLVQFCYLGSSFWGNACVCMCACCVPV